MRRILVDVARSKGYLKRGGGQAAAPLDDAMAVAIERSPDLIALDLALQALARFDTRKSRVVELRFFGGFSVEETADGSRRLSRDDPSRLAAGKIVAAP